MISADRRTAVAWMCLLVGFGCAPSPDSVSQDGLATALVGEWRAVLEREGPEAHGHELPFTITVRRTSGDELRAHAINGDERALFSAVRVDGEQVVFANEGYDSEITARLVEDDRLEGRWRKTQQDGDSTLRFVADRGRPGRFSDTPRPMLRDQQTAVDLSGEWTATFVDEDGPYPARGIFQQEGRDLEGTFRTSTGDYRYLVGEVESIEGSEQLRLSTFDGAHAFLFHARLLEDGTLQGDFWSRDVYHATWTARRAEPGDELPNPFEQVGLTNSEGRFAFAFPDTDGALMSSDDERFAGKVRLVEIFGSWCPNCNDSAPFLNALWERYHEQGLEIVGLAYEMTGEFERDARLVERYRERHQIPFPLLVAGTSDKEEAASTLPDLEAVLSFPTKVFIDRSGQVREIYSGYDGPSTGAAHEQMKRSIEELLGDLLAEAGP